MPGQEENNTEELVSYSLEDILKLAQQDQNGMTQDLVPIDSVSVPSSGTGTADDTDDGIAIHWPTIEDDGSIEDDLSGADQEDTEEQESPESAGSEDKEPFAFEDAEDADSKKQAEDERERKKEAKRRNEQRLSALRYRKNTNDVRAKWLRIFVPVVIAACFAGGFFLYFFRLQHLTFDNLTGYSTEEVFRATGLKKNMLIFRVSASDIKKRLSADFPYIEDVRAEYDYPDTVHLIFSEDCALFYTQIYQECFVISESMRVLARYDSPDEIPDKNLRCIDLPSVSYAVVGYELSFYDSSYLEFLTSVLDELEASSIYDRIQSMDLSNRSSLEFNYDGRITVELGSDEDIDTKLLFVESIIRDLASDEQGTMTLIDNKRAIFSALSASEKAELSGETEENSIEETAESETETTEETTAETPLEET